jgi:endonuclease G
VDDKEEPNLFNAYYPKGGSSYSHSRGHQLPSADRLASNEDNATTFYFTNMTPQLQSLNGDTWGDLEGDIRKKWMCSDTLYVVTGAHFEPGYGYAYDNKGNGKACAVPTHYYKVILRTKKGNSGKWVGNCSANELKCVGFWFNHAAKAQQQTMSVAEIEQKTGHTFFPNVPNAPKSTYNPSDWQ